MDNEVAWVVEVDVKPGQLDAFKALMEEMVEGTGAEPQTRNYEWYITGDRKTVHIFEKYADSEAMILHVNGFMSKWAARFMESVDMTRFTVYGDPSPAARELLDSMSASYMAPWGGFAR
jgi:quinol monooxygenase YgiN